MTQKVRIRKHKVRGKVFWVVCSRENGKRKREHFTSLDAAETHKTMVEAQHSGELKQWLEMSAGKREMIMHLIGRAETDGLDYIPGLIGAEKMDKPETVKKLSIVISELIDVKEKAGRDDGYCNTLRLVLEKFAAGRESAPINQITLADIETFLDAHSLAYRSTLRARLSTLFKFCVRREYRADNPCERLEPITYHKPPPAVFTHDQFKKAVKFLAKKCPKGLAWFALSTACGLRPEEAEKTTKKEINFKEGFVKVEAQTTKVRQRRVVYPLPEAMKLLKWAIKNGGRLPLPGVTRRRIIRRIREAIGFEKWPKDITRHTAASNWLAIEPSTAKVAKALGNSEKVIERDYKAIRTRIEAREFWKLVALYRPK